MPGYRPRLHAHSPTRQGSPMVSRREALVTTAAVASGAALLRSQNANAAPATGSRAWEASYSGSKQSAKVPPGQPGKDYQQVITPNGVALPWKVVDGVKVFHLIAEEVEHEMAPGLKVHCWGYNGRVHGPTIEAVE